MKKKLIIIRASCGAQSRVPSKITTKRDLSSFTKGIVQLLGYGYHPDTNFGDYTTKQGKRSFSPATAKKLERLRSQAFNAGDPYSNAIAEIERLK